MYEEIESAVLTSVARKMLADNVLDSKILQYTSLTEKQLMDIKEAIEREKQEEASYNTYIEGFKTLVKETILAEQDELLGDRVRDYCNKHHKIVDLKILKEVVKEAYEEKVLKEVTKEDF